MSLKSLSRRTLAWRRYSIVLLLPAIIFMFVGGLRGAPGEPQQQACRTTISMRRIPGCAVDQPGAGTPIAGLTTNQLSFFSAGLTDFEEIDSVSGAIANTGRGLGPRFNAESCAQCHAQPSTGGTSPSVNPQVAAATDQGAANQVPIVHHE